MLGTYKLQQQLSYSNTAKILNAIFLFVSLVIASECAESPVFLRVSAETIPGNAGVCKL